MTRFQVAAIRVLINKAATRHGGQPALTRGVAPEQINRVFEYWLI
ncbi:MAG: hypothetical protein JWO38_6526 [Gemmataceae bacterium]|nr:hypothetical protein [Gemmataceae bacterium]